MTDKERAKAVVDAQPEDATYDEILREMAFERMVERGLTDSQSGDTISHEHACTHRVVATIRRTKEAASWLEQIFAEHWTSTDT